MEPGIPGVFCGEGNAESLFDADSFGVRMRGGLFLYDGADAERRHWAYGGEDYVFL